MNAARPLHTLVVYESVFGNTKAVAEAIAFGLAGDVQLVEAQDAPSRLGPDVGLLVVGGPTHAFTMTTRSSRRRAAEMNGHPPAVVGIREWIGNLSMHPSTPVATFDTRIDRPRLPGFAARAAARLLRKAGLYVIVEPESFYVTGTPGPLKDGERERARAWGAGLAAMVAPVLAVAAMVADR